MIKEVDFGTVVPGKLQAVFVAVTAWARAWEHHHCAKGAGARNAEYLYPFVLLMARWDGAIGFPGGGVEPGEDLLAACSREGWEEARLAAPASALSSLCAHEADNIVVNLCVVNRRGVTSVTEMREVLGRSAINARDAIAEGTPFWAHLADYGNGQGWRRLRDSNALSTAVGEELDVVRDTMYANAPEGAWMGPP